MYIYIYIHICTYIYKYIYIRIEREIYMHITRSVCHRNCMYIYKDLSPPPLQWRRICWWLLSAWTPGGAPSPPPPRASSLQVFNPQPYQQHLLVVIHLNYVKIILISTCDKISPIPIIPKVVIFPLLEIIGI